MTTCAACGAGHLGNECTRCAMRAHSEARVAERRARWLAEQERLDAQPKLTIEELFLTLRIDVR